MIWFTWRQFRTQAAVTAAALAGFGVLLLVTVGSIADMYADVAACTGDCGTVIDGFLLQVRNSANGTLYNVTPSGQVFTGPADPSICGRNATPGTCREWLGTLGLRQDITYHPASHFWSLQWAETGIFLALAGLLAGFCFWWLRRRLT